jgi:hypothetical protein
MKYALILLSIISLAACNRVNTETKKDTPVFDAEKEQSAIMKVAEKETDAFYARDYEGWKSTRAQQAYDFQGWNNNDGTSDIENGWKQVDGVIKDYIEKNIAPIEAKPEVQRKNIHCKFYGNEFAYLTWDEYVREDSSAAFHRSKSLRLMEKQNGEWKIVAVAAFFDYKNNFSKDSIQ